MSAKRSSLQNSLLVKPLKPFGTIASYPAVPITQNKHRFYFATIPVEDIFPYTFISRIDEDSVRGFQRMLSEERARDIANYLDNSEGSIPTNIVLSAQEEAILEYNNKSKTMRYVRTPKAFLIIDGQHRMYGYGLTKLRKHRIPVSIYENLKRIEEAQIFIDINTNQRGVPAALLLDIKQVAERETQNETKLRHLFDQLNQDSASPLNGLMSPSRSSPGKISRVAFKRAVEPLLGDMVMAQISEEKQYVLLKNYLSAVEEILSDSTHLMTKAAYFESFCSIFPEVIRMAYTRHQNYRFEALKTILEPITNVNLEDVFTRGRTKITKATIVPVLKQAISGQIIVDEDKI